MAADGCTVIIASHDFNLLAARVDRLLVMREGHQHACGRQGCGIDTCVTYNIGGAAWPELTPGT